MREGDGRLCGPSLNAREGGLARARQRCVFSGVAGGVFYLALDRVFTCREGVKSELRRQVLVGCYE
jgi:hypothetical protein